MANKVTNNRKPMGCFTKFILSITALFFLLLALSLHLLFYSDYAVIKQELRAYRAHTALISDQYIEKYEGGRPLIESEDISYRNSPKLFTNDLQPTDCLKYNVCPEGNLIEKTIIKKVWMPDKSSYLYCGGTYFSKIVEAESETLIPDIFFNNQWGPKAYPCGAISSVKLLKYAISYSKNLVDVHQLCTTMYGDFMYLVSGNNKEASLVRDWTGCVTSRIESWLQENNKSKNSGGPQSFGEKTVNIQNLCSLEYFGEKGYLPPSNASPSKVRSWVHCATSNLESWMSEKQR